MLVLGCACRLPRSCLGPAGLGLHRRGSRQSVGTMSSSCSGPSPISESAPFPKYSLTLTPSPPPPSCKAADRWGSYDGAKPTGALCGPCRDTWWLGYSYMTQEALVEAAAADASPLKACFDSARSMVSQKNALEHRLAEVSKDTHIGVNVD